MPPLKLILNSLVKVLQWQNALPNEDDEALCERDLWCHEGEVYGMLHRENDVKTRLGGQH